LKSGALEVARVYSSDHVATTVAVVNWASCSAIIRWYDPPSHLCGIRIRATKDIRPDERNTQQAYAIPTRFPAGCSKKAFRTIFVAWLVTV